MGVFAKMCVFVKIAVVVKMSVFVKDHTTALHITAMVRQILDVIESLKMTLQGRLQL
jgi:hypothetical protein